MARSSKAKPTSGEVKHEHTVLVLQGGGALGAYQAGVFEGMHEQGFAPDWVTGVSIGAINGALIAGNPPEKRIERLREFWDRVSSGMPVVAPAQLDPVRIALNRLSAATAATFGVPGFFVPRVPPAFLAPDGSPGALSVYDTSPLRATLEELVDFNLLNDRRRIRLSVGAVDVHTGNSIYFDNRRGKLAVEHVMASGSLPPGFPPIEIDGEQYWDGGLFSNTPLQYVVDYSPRRSRLIFQVDVFPAHGRVPANLDEVNERDKDIRYSSRTRLTTETLREKHDVRHAIKELHKLLPPDLANTEQAKRLYEHGCVTEMDVVQLIYRPMEPQGSMKDFEFSRSTMQARWQQGLSDARTTLHASPWLAPMPRELGVRVFDVIHDMLVAHRKPARATPAGA